MEFNFQTISIIVAVILLLIILGTLAYTISSSKKSGTIPWPPVVGTCPDYWTDLSGNGNHGTLYNSPTYSSLDGNGSLEFNGSTQYMQANINSTLLDGDPNFTIEFFNAKSFSLITCNPSFLASSFGKVVFPHPGVPVTNSRI